LENFLSKKEEDINDVVKVKEIFHNDAEYVRSLGNWEKRHLPKLNPNKK